MWGGEGLMEKLLGPFQIPGLEGRVCHSPSAMPPLPPSLLLGLLFPFLLFSLVSFLRPGCGVAVWVLAGSRRLELCHLLCDLG